MNFGKIKRVLWIVLWFNIAVAASKVILGIFSGAISILSDGVHSGFDSLTNVAGLIGIHFAEKPADSDHPYGHQKYEALTAMLIFFFLIITGWEMAKSTFGKIMDPATIHAKADWLSVASIVLICCLIIDIIIARYEFKKGEKLKSRILRADAKHTKSHYATTGAVIAATIGIKFGLPPIVDPIAACIVIFFIGKLAYEILKDTLVVLSDQCLVDAEKVKKAVETIPGVESCHKIRSRGDESHIFLDIHIIVNPNLSVKCGHDICHAVEEKIKKEVEGIQDVIIHAEPPDIFNV